MSPKHRYFPISSPTEIKASGFGEMNCHLWQAPKKLKITRFSRKLGRRSPWNEHFDFVSRSLRKKEFRELARIQLFGRMWAAVEVHETFKCCFPHFFSCWVDPNRAKLSHRFARSNPIKVKRVVKIITFWWPKVAKLLFILFILDFPQSVQTSLFCMDFRKSLRKFFQLFSLFCSARSTEVF